MNGEIEKLKQEIAELRARLEYTDDWVGGVQRVLVSVLPGLLQNHPKVELIQELLKRDAERYALLEVHPERAVEDDLSLANYEPGKMLYHLLALQGVWPGVDPLDAAKASVERARR